MSHCQATSNCSLPSTPPSWYRRPLEKIQPKSLIEALKHSHTQTYTDTHKHMDINKHTRLRGHTHTHTHTPQRSNPTTSFSEDFTLGEIVYLPQTVGVLPRSPSRKKKTITNSRSPQCSFSNLTLQEVCTLTWQSIIMCLKGHKLNLGQYLWKALAAIHCYISVPPALPVEGTSSHPMSHDSFTADQCSRERANTT